MDNARARRILVTRWDNLAELEAVRVFAVVAELRSFRGAAAALRVPRSTVSRRIAALEAALEARLLQRTTRHVSLTEAGETFLASVGPALSTIADAGRSVLDARAEPRGLVRVTATDSAAESVGSILLELIERYPDIRLELDFSDRQVDLVAEGYDIAVRPGALADSSLIARPLGHGRGGYFASPAYLKRRGRPKVPRDLLKHDCIVFSGSRRGERWRFHHRKRIEDITVGKRIVANAIVVVRLAAIAGHGVAWIPGMIAAGDVERGKLVPVLAAYWPPPIPVQLVYPSARHLAPQVRAAIDLLQERLKIEA
jgi:DNA-binding transcriptional LysR family regulator